MAAPSLTLTTYATAAAFRDRVQPFLLRQEAANNLILGLISSIIDTPRHFPVTPYFAAVADDADGAIVAAFLRTPPYRLIISTSNHPAALGLVAFNLQGSGTELPGVTGPVSLAQAFATLWQARTGVAWELERSLRIFSLRRVQPVSGVRGSLRRATLADQDLIIEWLFAFAAEAGTDGDRDRIIQGIGTRLDSPPGGLWFWEVAGMPVSLVGAGGLTPRGIRIGPVYTAPEHRRTGYASAATAAVSQLLLDSGRELVFLYTDLANPTANHIYQTIGYEPVCDTVDIAFLASPAVG